METATDTRIDRRQWLLAGFVASYYPLLGLKRAFSLIGILLALWGMLLIWRRRATLLENPAIQTAALIAVAFWLPLLLALPDANFFTHSLGETLKSALYLPILVSMILLVQEQRITRPFYWSAVAILGFWTLDAFVQQFAGQDLFGRILSPQVGRIGAYWLNQAKFGYYMGFFGLFGLAALAVLAPRRPLLMTLAWLLTAAAVLFSGNREAWVMFFPFSVLLFWVHIAKPSRYPWLFLLVALALAAGVALLAWEFSPTVQTRVALSLQGFSLDYDTIDQASSKRLGIWVAALELSAQHWFNGLGMEGFQLTFPSYTDDPFWKTAGAEMYTHQFILEVLTASGLLGLLGLIAITILLIRIWRRATPEQRSMAWPALIYLAALWFPLNSHRSFYSSELMMGNWIMLGLLVGNLLPFQQRASAAVSATT